MNNCCDDLKKLQKQLQLLLIANGEFMQLISKGKKQPPNNNNLISRGFSPKVVKSVAAKMKRSGRPASHFSKKTGLLKAS